MKFKLTFVVMIVALLTSYAANSQTWDQAKGLGLTGSIFKFLGGDVDRAAPGLSGGLSLRYGFNPYLMLDLNANYGSFQPTEDGEAFKVESNSPYQTFLMPITLDVRLTPAPESHFKPYFYIGGGVLIWDLRNVSGTDKSFLKDLELRWGDSVYGRTKREAIYKTGLGLETFITKSLSLDLQAGIVGVANSNPSDNVGYMDHNDYAVTGRASLSFYFGYFKDKDRDGIADKLDKCPELYGLALYDGCPDSDGDGIPDNLDECPNKPGPAENKGCPWPDKDGDGIPDREDRCPDQAGPAKFNGCPDTDDDGIPDIDDRCPNQAGLVEFKGCPDTDGDGIPDIDDKCPDKPGPASNNGCPEKKIAPALEKKGAKLILKGINFETNSDKLTPESFAILDEVIVGLIDNKDVSLEVRGYTDDRGSATYNQKLSERRAIAVMQYLVSKGVEQSRLTAAGYGKKDPVASNATPEGRAQNRRIEFVRTK